MTFTHRLQRARAGIAEIVEVTRIAMALQNREITAEQASAAISRMGGSQPARQDDAAREFAAV